MAALAAGCQLDTRVAIDVREDGSGRVEVSVALDEAAAERVPGLADQLAVDDLVATGWTVSGPSLDADGLTWIRASKPFASPERAALVLDEITGADGPLRDIAVSRHPSLFWDEWQLTGTVDLGDGLAGFSDDALRERLDGTNVGLTDDEIAAIAGRPLAEVLTLEVAVSLPGEVSANGRAEGGRAVWEPELGERLELTATGSRLHTATITWLVVAATAALALVVVVVRRARRRHRRALGAPAAPYATRARSSPPSSRSVGPSGTGT